MRALFRSTLFLALVVLVGFFVAAFALRITAALLAWVTRKPYTLSRWLERCCERLIDGINELYERVRSQRIEEAEATAREAAEPLSHGSVTDEI